MRLERAIALLRRFKFRDTKHIFFTDENSFISTHQLGLLHKTTEFGRVQEESQRQASSSAQNLLVMVSAGVCFGGKGRLHFVDEKAKVDAAHQKLFKTIEKCVKAGGGHFEHLK